MNEYDAFPAPSEEPVFPTGNKELRFAAAIAIACLLLANFAVFHGYNLGFALAAAGCIVITTVYLLRSGCKPDLHSTPAALLLLLIPRLGYLLEQGSELCYSFLNKRPIYILKILGKE